MSSTIRLALCLALAGIPSAASAEETLNKAELTALVTGNTVHFRDLQSGPHGRAYHDPKGEILVDRDDGSTFSGIWSVRQDGAHCMITSGEICGKVHKNGDGTYTRVILGDGRRFQWTKITPGKAF